MPPMPSPDAPRAVDVTGLLLAGGRSRRFGADKARAPVEGRPMIERVHDVVAPLVAEVLVSVRAVEDAAGLPGRPVADRVEGAGPLGGLHAGLWASGRPWLLAVACDLPYLQREPLRALLAARVAGRPVVAETPDGRHQPLCALYPASILPAVEAALVAGRLALQDLIAATDAVIVPVDAAPLRNVNRPSDLL